MAGGDKKIVATGNITEVRQSIGTSRPESRPRPFQVGVRQGGNEIDAKLKECCNRGGRCPLLETHLFFRRTDKNTAIGTRHEAF